MEIEKVSQARVKELQKGAPTKGHVEIRLKDPKRTGTIVVRDYLENDSPREFVNSNGSHIVKRIQRTIHLNMEKVNDRLLYNQVKFHPLYVDGPNPVLLLVDHQEAADDFVVKRKLATGADEIITKLKPEEAKNFARVLLIMVKPGASEASIQRALFEKATENPSLVIKEWNNPDRDMKALIKKGIEVGVFNNANGRYTYQSTLMGTSFEFAIEWLRENEDMIPNLTKTINAKK